jgi:excisionase family DNA binding protein
MEDSAERDVVGARSDCQENMAMVTVPERDYYTVSEVARKLRVSPSTVWRWIEAGALRAYQVGPRSIRVKREDVASIIKPVRRDSTARETGDIWANYDPAKVVEVLEKVAGGWADLNADALTAEMYRARAEGSRPSARP